jgi:hypothetical protein
MVVCQLEDGSLLFASTESIMWDVLIKMDLDPVYMETAKEYTHYEVRNGRITLYQELDKPKYSYSRYDTKYYRKQTAGGYESMWDDDFDDWADSFDKDGYYAPLEPSLTTTGTDTDDEYPPFSFYVEVRDRISFVAEVETILYDPDEYRMFRSDIWYLKSGEDENALIDYGRIDMETGEYHSYSAFPEKETQDIATYSLM